MTRLVAGDEVDAVAVPKDPSFIEWTVCVAERAWTSALPTTAHLLWVPTNLGHDRDEERPPGGDRSCQP
jgi:hypothetical protein